MGKHNYGNARVLFFNHPGKGKGVHIADAEHFYYKVYPVILKYGHSFP